MLTEIRVGKILTTHGLKGEVKVEPTTDRLDRFAELTRVFLRQRSDAPERELEIESVRYQNNTVLLKFKGLNRIEDVEAFRNGDLYIPRAESIPLQQGEYFVGDLIGIRVEDETGKTLGTLVDVINTGSTPVYAVTGDGGHEILIPKVPEMILELKPEEGYMKVHLIPGLLDLNS